MRWSVKTTQCLLGDVFFFCGLWGGFFGGLWGVGGVGSGFFRSVLSPCRGGVVCLTYLDACVGVRGVVFFPVLGAKNHAQRGAHIRALTGVASSQLVK